MVKKRCSNESQEDYCQDCAVFQDGGCNVLLSDNETCGDYVPDTRIMTADDLNDMLESERD